MSAPVRVADDASLSVLDDEGVFFCCSAQEIHLFNTPATYLWCCLERGLPLTGLVASFAGAFRLSLSEAERRVVETMNRWRECGYLQGAERRASSTSRSKEEEARSSSIAFETDRDRARQRRNRSRRPARRGSLRLLATRFQLELELPEYEKLVWPVVAHLETDDDPSADAALEVVREGDEHVVRLDGVERRRCSGVEELAPAIKAELWEVAVNRHSYFMEIHAGAVFDGRACTLLPGAPGRGKTTLTAGLISAGFRYLSDESVLLDARTLNVRALPLALAIKQGAVKDLSRYYPKIHELPVHRRADGVAVRYLPPPASARLPVTERPLPVDSLAFPDYSPGAPTRLRPISRPEALRRLLDQCLVLPGRLDVRDVRDLVQWMRGLTCLELTFSSVESAVELLAHRLQTPVRGTVDQQC